MFKSHIHLLSLVWHLLKIDVEHLLAMIECLPLNHVNLDLQSVIPAIINCFRLLLKEIVHNLSESLLGHTLDQVSKISLLTEWNISLWVISKVIIFIILSGIICARPARVSFAVMLLRESQIICAFSNHSLSDSILI